MEFAPDSLVNVNSEGVYCEEIRSRRAESRGSIKMTDSGGPET